MLIGFAANLTDLLECHLHSNCLHGKSVHCLPRAILEMISCPNTRRLLEIGWDEIVKCKVKPNQDRVVLCGLTLQQILALPFDGEV